MRKHENSLWQEVDGWTRWKIRQVCRFRAATSTLDVFGFPFLFSGRRSRDDCRRVCFNLWLVTSMTSGFESCKLNRFGSWVESAKKDTLASNWEPEYQIDRKNEVWSSVTRVTITFRIFRLKSKVLVCLWTSVERLTTIRPEIFSKFEMTRKRFWPSDRSSRRELESFLQDQSVTKLL